MDRRSFTTPSIDSSYTIIFILSRLELSKFDCGVFFSEAQKWKKNKAAAVFGLYYNTLCPGSATPHRLGDRLLARYFF